MSSGSCAESASFHGADTLRRVKYSSRNKLTSVLDAEEGSSTGRTAARTTAGAWLQVPLSWTVYTLQSSDACPNDSM